MIARQSSISALIAALTLVLAPGCGGGHDGAAAGSAAARLPESVRFNRDVRPILTDKCFACHGPDANQRQADLRLDVRDSALSDRKGVHAIVPGDVTHSELVRRISSSDPEYRMPPPRSNRTLGPREIALLTKWVKQGAEYEPHWAYVPLHRPVPPPVKDTQWVENPIDQFVLARLEEHGVTPSPDANPYTLARRLSFDIVGLPPKPKEVDAFVRNEKPSEYADFVDRLLASPHYGERMAVYWLDLVRYADTNGYNEDQHHDIYPYRDYVIRAFNDDMPFDEFTIEQLAGDLLPAPTRWQRVASGYNRLNKVSTENGSQEKEFLAKYAADRVRTTATVWMGATLGCAECHDHKFDPYTSKDFYSFAAFFADVEGEAVPRLGRIALPPEIAVPPPDQAAQLDELTRRVAELRAQRGAAVAQQRQRFEADLEGWERSEPRPSSAIVIAQPPFVLADWTPLLDGGTLDESGQLRLVSPLLGNDGVERRIRTGRGNLEFLLDVAAFHFPRGSADAAEAFTWSMRQKDGIHGISVSVNRAIGRPISIGAMTDVNDVRVVQLGTPEDLASMRLRVVWNESKRQWSVSYGVNGAPPLTPFPGGPMIDPSRNEPAEKWGESIRMAAIPLGLLTNPGLKKIEEPPARFEVLIKSQVVRRYDPVADPPADVAAIRRTPSAERSAAQSRKLESYYTSVTPQLATWNDQIDRLEAQKLAIEAPLPHTLVTVAMKPRITRVLNRGNWQDETGEIVEPAVPAFLPPLPKGSKADRLALARWLVSPDNPLTARVLVNRLWMLFFGHGIVRTLDDLGSQGAQPSHPELLDWLASELIDSGWDVKHVIRLLVTSRTYRQSSVERADLREIDPENDLFARQSSFRLDAEMIRDNALTVSGLLSPEIGGPSVKPYQPEHYWDRVSQVLPGSPAARWRPSHGKEQYRRGLYTYWKRTYLHPSLAAFDAPTREECVAERARSNTPLQALVLLNDPTYVEAARVLAERAARLGGVGPDAQIRWAYLQTLSRPPDADVLKILRGVFDKQLQEYRAQPESSHLLAKVGFSPAVKGWNARPAQLAALTSVCRVLLNLDETITRY